MTTGRLSAAPLSVRALRPRSPTAAVVTRLPVGDPEPEGESRRADAAVGRRQSDAVGERQRRPPWGRSGERGGGAGRGRRRQRGLRRRRCGIAAGVRRRVASAARGRIAAAGVGAARARRSRRRGRLLDRPDARHDDDRQRARRDGDARRAGRDRHVGDPLRRRRGGAAVPPPRLGSPVAGAGQRQRARERLCRLVDEHDRQRAVAAARRGVDGEPALVAADGAHRGVAEAAAGAVVVAEEAKGVGLQVGDGGRVPAGGEVEPLAAEDPERVGLDQRVRDALVGRRVVAAERQVVLAQRQLRARVVAVDPGVHPRQQRDLAADPARDRCTTGPTASAPRRRRRRPARSSAGRGSRAGGSSGARRPRASRRGTRRRAACRRARRGRAGRRRCSRRTAAAARRRARCRSSSASPIRRGRASPRRGRPAWRHWRARPTCRAARRSWSGRGGRRGACRPTASARCRGRRS